MTTLAWPFTVNHLAERGSYSLDPHDDNIRTDFDKGPSRVRQRFTRSSSYVTLSIYMTPLDFEQFKSFYRFDLGQGKRWFLIPMYLSFDYTTVEARFKGKYKADNADTLNWLVSMVLEVRDLPIDSVYEFQFLFDHVCDPIQTAVNVTLPAITASYSP